MPVRKATPEETREWLGDGLVTPARRAAPAQPQDADQAAHDRWMASRTPAQPVAVVEGLGAWARSNLDDMPPGEQA